MCSCHGCAGSLDRHTCTVRGKSHCVGSLEFRKQIFPDFSHESGMQYSKTVLVQNEAGISCIGPADTLEDVSFYRSNHLAGNCVPP